MKRVEVSHAGRRPGIGFAVFLVLAFLGVLVWAIGGGSVGGTPGGGLNTPPSSTGGSPDAGGGGGSESGLPSAGLVEISNISNDGPKLFGDMVTFSATCEGEGDSGYLVVCAPGTACSASLSSESVLCVGAPTTHSNVNCSMEVRVEDFGYQEAVAVCCASPGKCSIPKNVPPWAGGFDSDISIQTGVNVNALTFSSQSKITPVISTQVGAGMVFNGVEGAGFSFSSDVSADAFWSVPIAFKDLGVEASPAGISGADSETVSFVEPLSGPGPGPKPEWPVSSVIINPALAVDVQNNQHVVFAVRDVSGKASMYYTSCTSAQPCSDLLSWSVPIEPVDAFVNPKPWQWVLDSPLLIAQGNELYVVFSDSNPVQSQRLDGVFIGGCSSDCADPVNWAQPVMVGPSNGFSREPFVRVHNGVLHAVWSDTVGSGIADIFYSSCAGNCSIQSSWTPKLNVSNTPSLAESNPTLDASADKMVFAWEGSGEVWARACSNPCTEEVLGAGFNVSNNPSTSARPRAFVYDAGATGVFWQDTEVGGILNVFGSLLSLNGTALALLGQGPVTFDSAIQSQDVVLYQNKVSNSAALKWAYTRGNGTEIYLTSTNYADSAGAAGGDGEAGLKLLAPLPGSIVGPKAVGSETVPFVFELSGTSGVQGPLYVNVELVAPGSSGEKTVLFDAVSLDALDSAPTPFLSCVNSEAMLVSTCTFKKEVGAIPTGPYLVSASLVNESGAVLASDATPYAVTFDFEAPQLMVQAPVQETANTSKLVVFTVKDNVGVALEDVYFFVNGDHVGFEEGACSQPDPNLWLCGQQANAIQPGANLFGLQALDVAGNQGTLEPFAFSYSETPLADQNCPVFELSDQNTTIVTLPFPFKTVFEVPGTALYFFGSGIEKGVEVASSAVESLGAFKYVLLLLAGIASGLLCFQLLGRFFEGVKTTRRERMETMKRGILSLALALLVLYVGLNVRVFNGIAVAVLEVVLVLVGVFVVQRIQRMHAFKPVRVEKPR